MLCAVKYLSFSLVTWVSQIVRYLAVAALPTIPALFVHYISPSLFLSLGIKVFLYFSVYLLLLRLFRIPEFYLLSRIVKKEIRKF